jgi:hypothetical protein
MHEEATPVWRGGFHQDVPASCRQTSRLAAGGPTGPSERRQLAGWFAGCQPADFWRQEADIMAFR